MTDAETRSDAAQEQRTAPGTVTATARAHPNIALVKYWGKRDERLSLPVADSLSMTLDIFPTTTRVTLDPHATVDRMVLDGAPARDAAFDRVGRFLDVVRASAGRSEYAVVDSVNTVPTGAGLASSASGFAALAVAAAAAYGLPADGRALSRLARRGSGSACRSIFDGFAVWHAGTGVGATGDLSSYAETFDATMLDPAMVIAVVDDGPKKVPSRAAMRHTAETSPYFEAWVRTCALDVARMRAAITDGDFATVGELTEHNALGMHAAMLAARPSIRYLSPTSVAVLDRIQALRAAGLEAYATIDAGPNVVALCTRPDAARVAAVLASVDDSIAVHTAHRGPAATLVAEAVP